MTPGGGAIPRGSQAWTAQRFYLTAGNLDAVAVGDRARRGRRRHRDLAAEPAALRGRAARGGGGDPGCRATRGAGRPDRRRSSRPPRGRSARAPLRSLAGAARGRRAPARRRSRRVRGARPATPWPTSTPRVSSTRAPRCPSRWPGSGAGAITEAWSAPALAVLREGIARRPGRVRRLRLRADLPRRLPRLGALSRRRLERPRPRLRQTVSPGHSGGPGAPAALPRVACAAGTSRLAHARRCLARMTHDAPDDSGSEFREPGSPGGPIRGPSVRGSYTWDMLKCCWKRAVTWS